MPLLRLTQAGRKIEAGEGGAIDGRLLRPEILGQCANPPCRSGWLHLFRKRGRPVFEGGWTCSRECTEMCLQLAVQRELGDHPSIGREGRHRVPIGLLMLEQGWITRSELRSALDHQRRSGGRLGEWLVKRGSTDEATVTRALGLQWSCPVLSIDPRGSAASVVGIMPRLFIDAFGALPIRIQAKKLLYLGFEASLDPALAYGIERMTGLRVESGIVQTSSFRSFQAQLLKQVFPPLQLAEAASASAAAHLLGKTLERTQPAASRLVRVHDFLWLRMFLSADSSPVFPSQMQSIRDCVCTIGTI